MSKSYTIDASFEENRHTGLPLFVLGELLQSKTGENGRISFFEEEALNDFTDRMLADRQSLDGLRDLIASQACHNPALAKAFGVDHLAFTRGLSGITSTHVIPVSDMDEWKRSFVESGFGIEHDPEALMIAALSDLSNSVLQRPFAASIEEAGGSSRGIIFMSGEAIEYPGGKEALAVITDRNRIHKENHALVVSYLHHTGANNAQIPMDHQMEVYALADGFGYLDRDTLAEINDGWDWSHIRDSTDEGWQRMATWLRDTGYGPDGPAARPQP